MIFCNWGRCGPSAATCVLAVLAGCGGGKNEYVAPPPPEVTVLNPLKRSVIVFLEQTGETEAVERAEVRARVRGFVQAVEFEPGQVVESDTLLYRIEDDQYVATKASAVAELSAAEASISVAESAELVAQAELKRAGLDVERQQSLQAQNATSKSEFDAAVAANESAQAMLAAANAEAESAQASKQRAQANLDNAELDLEYTHVRAPIRGRVTKTDIKLGNLVEYGTQLAVVVNDDQIFANFSISDRQLLEYLEERETAENTSPMGPQAWSQITVELQRELDEGFPFRGRLDYVDQEGVERQTGTLQMRARFDNQDGELFPGLFVRIRVPMRELENALLIPERAVQQDRTGKYVLVTNADNQVERRDVILGQAVDSWVVVTTGLVADDSVVVDGLQRARPGLTVNPMVKVLSEADEPTLPGAEVTTVSEVDANVSRIAPSTEP